MNEVARRELFTGSGIYVVTVEYEAWKVVGSALCPVEIGPFPSEEEAIACQETQRNAIIGKYLHQENYYERFGKRVF